MYVITGATGHTGQRIAQALLAAGKPVKAIARHADKLAGLASQGATVVTGDLGDQAFLTEALRGATAVYLMIPPTYAVNDWPVWLENMGAKYAQAIRESGVKKVVLLSSTGAHRTAEVGPIGGLAKLEKLLQAIPGIDVLALRPGYFMENFFSSVDMIKHMGINGSVTKGDVPVSMVHTRDIADVAARRLLDLDFKGYQVEYITGPADLTFTEATSILGRAIGKPELPYVSFSAADGFAGMVQAGLPETIAAGYVEMSEGINKGYLLEEYRRDEATKTPTSFEWFVENELKNAF